MRRTVCKKGKMLTLMTFAAKLARRVGLALAFEHHAIARGRLWVKSSSSPWRFSSRLAHPSRCSNLQQKRWHGPANLSRRQSALFGFPRSIDSVSKRAGQHQLIQGQPYQLTPALKLFGCSNMSLRPKQILLHEPVAMLMRKAMGIAGSYLLQGHVCRELDKPALTRIAFAVFGSLAYHANDTDLHVATLLEMQPAPAREVDRPALFIGSTPAFIGTSQRLCSAALHHWSIQGHAAFRTLANGLAVELAVALE